MPNVLITGANRGIGLELAKQLSARGDRVFAACRAADDALVEQDVEVIDGIDVTRADVGARLASHLGDTRLDVLINNAGILTSESLGDMDLDRIRRQFEVNTLGPLKVVLGLLDRLSAGAKLALISSRVGSLEDNGSGGYYGYRMSKVALNMVGVNLAHDLKSRGITVVLLHPGMVATDMTAGAGISPAEAARGLIARIDASSLTDTGSFWHANGERLPW